MVEAVQPIKQLQIQAESQGEDPADAQLMGSPCNTRNRLRCNVNDKKETDKYLTIYNT